MQFLIIRGGSIKVFFLLNKITLIILFKRVFAFIATIDHIKYNLRLVFTRQVSETDNVFFSMQKSLHYCLVYSSASKGLDNNWITDLLNTFPTDRPSFFSVSARAFLRLQEF